MYVWNSQKRTGCKEASLAGGKKGKQDMRSDLRKPFFPVLAASEVHIIGSSGASPAVYLRNVSR